jgi:hypothetical protein
VHQVVLLLLLVATHTTHLLATVRLPIAVKAKLLTFSLLLAVAVVALVLAGAEVLVDIELALLEA